MSFTPRLEKLALNTKARKLINKFRLRTTSSMNLHRLDASNPGDLWSSPVHYFPFLKKFVPFDICTVGSPGDLAQKIIIVGGGGLLQNDFFAQHVQHVADANSKMLICWGAGQNDHGIDVSSSPQVLEAFDLVGIRDFGLGYEWVPCASCMHPAFERNYKIVHEFVVYDHPHFSPLQIDGFPKLSNIGSTIEEALSFLASATTVITSSYHGAYWATLLGRRVIIVNPFSTKFQTLKHRHPITSAEQWRSAMSSTQTYPESLDECRQSNTRFAEVVEQRLSEIRI